MRPLALVVANAVRRARALPPPSLARQTTGVASGWRAAVCAAVARGGRGLRVEAWAPATRIRLRREPTRHDAKPSCVHGQGAAAALCDRRDGGGAFGRAHAHLPRAPRAKEVSSRRAAEVASCDRPPPDQLLEKEVARCYATGAWEDAPPDERTHVCRVHLVPKKTPPGEPQKWRCVVDLRPTNAFCVNRGCKYETLKLLQRLARRGEWALSYDLQGDRQDGCRSFRRRSRAASREDSQVRDAPRPLAAGSEGRLDAELRGGVSCKKFCRALTVILTVSHTDTNSKSY